MCGIAGILQCPGQGVEPADLAAMAAALAHRGPDDEGFYLEGNIGLAHRRLSILDLTPAGHQPMRNEDGTVWAVYNGQLYGFDPTREWLAARGHRFRSRTDTEILVHLYEEKGEEMLEGVDGMFAFALWDAARRKLLLARDRVGIKPLYYAQNGLSLVFASEMKALLALPWLPRELDPLVLVQYLYQSSVPGEASVVKGIRKLGPGQCLVAEDGSLRLKTYWTLPPEAAGAPEPFEAATASFEAQFARAVRSHLVADVPVGTFLSGGLDSSAVTLEAKRALGGPLHTFSVRFGGPDHDEGPAAREVAEALGAFHHELFLGPECVSALPDVIRQADEPFAVSSALALYHLSRFARERVKVVLTGDGADEILAGYPWRHEPEMGPGSNPVSFLRGLAMTGVRSLRGARSGGPGLPGELAGRLGRMIHRPDERYAEIVHAFIPEEMDALLLADLRELGRRAWAESPVRTRYATGTARDEVNRRLRTDFATTLVDEMLTKVDRMTMAAGLEARVPFLDRSLVEWAFQQPGRYKVRGGTGKLVLRKALAGSLARTAARRKHGFNVPLGLWLGGPLRGLLLDALSPSAVRRMGLLRPEAVERLLTAHLDGGGDHSRKLFTLLVLEMWLAQISKRDESPSAHLSKGNDAFARQ